MKRMTARDPAKAEGASTRAKILDVALALFNDKAPDRVTTAEIARTVGINEGNLYYHFKTKEALLQALLKRLEGDAASFMADAGSSTATDPGIFSGFMRRWFSIVWDHRYIFRDLPGIIAIAPSLREPTRALSSGMRIVVEETLLRMTDAQLIDVPGEEAPPLLANVWIVSTYWAVYLNLQEGVEELEQQHLNWGLKQVASLFRPYLSEDAKSALDATLGRPVVPNSGST